MRALIIDDSPDYVVLLGRYLARELVGVEIMGYLPAEHGNAIPDLSETAADIILLDYDLDSAGDGLEWLRMLRAQPGCPPVIFMTAYGDEYLAVRAIKLGAADYVNKRDLDSTRLAEMIRATLVERPEVDWSLGDDARGAADQPPAPAAAPDAASSSAREPAGDGYRFLRVIGAGAMSEVYLAERSHDRMSLALKVISLKNLPTEEVRERFLREAELASSVDSPFVVRVYDFGFTPTYGYMAMELFTRGDLKQRVERGVNVDDAALYLWNIAQGLSVIHRCGIVHRDLKPENIMFRSDDSMAIADFGISKRLVDSTLVTTIGKVMGTPHYMSPEQGQGLDVDARSDLYAAGILLFELLTGMPPFDSTNPLSVIHQHVSAPVPRLPAAVAHFQPIIDRLLAKSPGERYPDAGGLAEALREHVR